MTRRRYQPTEKQREAPLEKLESFVTKDADEIFGSSGRGFRTGLHALVGALEPDEPLTVGYMFENAATIARRLQIEKGVTEATAASYVSRVRTAAVEFWRREAVREGLEAAALTGSVAVLNDMADEAATADEAASEDRHVPALDRVKKVVSGTAAETLRELAGKKAADVAASELLKEIAARTVRLTTGEKIREFRQRLDQLKGAATVHSSAAAAADALATPRFTVPRLEGVPLAELVRTYGRQPTTIDEEIREALIYISRWPNLRSHLLPALIAAMESASGRKETGRSDG